MWTVERSSRRASVTRSSSSRSPSIASVTSSIGGNDSESSPRSQINLWQTGQKPYFPMEFAPKVTSLQRASSRDSISSRASHATLVNDVEDTSNLKTPTAPPTVSRLHLNKPLPPALKKVRHQSALPDFDSLPDSAALPDFSELPDSAALPDFDNVPPTAMYPSTPKAKAAPSNLGKASASGTEVTATLAAGVPVLPAGFVGPLEQILMSIMPKISNIEKTQPSVMAEDYQSLKAENEALKKKYDNLFARYEAIYALRDEDLQNLIKVRGLLATERRQHEGLKKLRDEDLQNLINLRDKLAKNNWSGKSSASSNRNRSVRQSRVDSSATELWQVAKMAALEQRCLELEKVNKDLKSRSGTSTPVESHVVSAPGSVSAGNVSMDRIEALLENTITQREKIASKVQKLRSEKDSLQKTVEQLEDRNTELESSVERLERKLANF